MLHEWWWWCVPAWRRAAGGRSPAPGVLDGWLLYAQEALAADTGRGTGLGRFFTPDGEHLATVVQEGMIRTTSGGS